MSSLPAPRIARDERGAPWLMRFSARPWARARLVCLPHGGGSAGFYRSWARRMPSDVEVIAVQYPGRMNRLAEARIDSMEPMADEVAEVLEAHIRPPYALFGHSMGAAIAFEVALRLERDDRLPPSRLFVSGRGGPSRHRPGRRHLASDSALVRYLRILGGTEGAVFDQPEMWPVLLPLLRADFKLSETWEPDPSARVRCPLTAFTGDQDPEVDIDRARAWALATDSEFRLRVLAGNHFYLLEHEASMLEEIRLALG
jgi:pyochelin biosynthetic protein PchC